jgi:phosphoribosylamine--glycine ligase
MPSASIKIDEPLRLLLVGAGGREHALVWKLAQSPLVAKIYCAPGNPGIAQLAACVDISSSNIAALRRFAQEARIDLTVVGPEVPLVAGIVDEFEAHGLYIFGPSQQAAMLEGSKAFAKDFMRKYRIPTAEYRIFTHAEDARQHVQSCKIPVVVKADGLAAGKGAIVAHSRNEALNALATIMEQKQFGEAGHRVVIEEFMEGEEVSVFCLTDGVNLCILPSAQDHKAIYNGDLGPNTGGMGAYSPAPILSAELLQRVHRQILQPVIEGMALERKPYRGILYAGLMITAEGPKVVEFNCRFGDPEAQVVLPLITSDLVEAMWLVARGDLSDYRLTLSSQWALTVVLASAGYPGEYQTGKVINGVPRPDENNVLAFHAGTQIGLREKLVTSGGRVLAITGLGDTFQQARERAYLAVNRVRFEGEYHRTDIGAKALKHLRSS